MVLGVACLLLQGEQLIERLYIPRLRVKKNWYVGLNPDPIDHSHPDVGKADAAAHDLLDHAARAAQAAHHQHAAHTHGGHTAAHAPQHTPQQPPPPPPPPQQQPAHASIPTQPLAQAQQQQQPQTGGHAPALPQPPPPQAAHPQPAQQHPTQQPAQQPTNPPAQQQQQQAQAAQQQQQQRPKDMSAVLKVKERIDNYAKQFGQVRVCGTHVAKQQSRQAGRDRKMCVCVLPAARDKDSSRQDTTLSREDWADPLQPGASSDSKHTHP